MPDEQTTANGDWAETFAPEATEAIAVSHPDALDLAQRLKVIMAELETGVRAEPADLMTPSEKLRALADLTDRRAATAAPPTAS
jgi:hypothetical protein